VPRDERRADLHEVALRRCGAPRASPLDGLTSGRRAAAPDLPCAPRSGPPRHRLSWPLRRACAPAACFPRCCAAALGHRDDRGAVAPIGRASATERRCAIRHRRARTGQVAARARDRAGTRCTKSARGERRAAQPGGEAHRARRSRATAVGFALAQPPSAMRRRHRLERQLARRAPGMLDRSAPRRSPQVDERAPRRPATVAPLRRAALRPLSRAGTTRQPAWSASGERHSGDWRPSLCLLHLRRRRQRRFRSVPELGSARRRRRVSRRLFVGAAASRGEPSPRSATSAAHGTAPQSLPERSLCVVTAGLRARSGHHTASSGEALALPTHRAVRFALALEAFSIRSEPFREVEAMPAAARPRARRRAASAWRLRGRADAAPHATIGEAQGCPRLLRAGAAPSRDACGT
jgi:hypothetical protein